MTDDHRVDFRLHANDTIEALLIETPTFDDLNTFFNEINTGIVEFV